MKIIFENIYTKEEKNFINSVLNDVGMDINDEYLYVGKINFIAIKTDDIVTISKLGVI